MNLFGGGETGKDGYVIQNNLYPVYYWSTEIINCNSSPIPTNDGDPNDDNE